MAKKEMTMTQTTVLEQMLKLHALTQVSALVMYWHNTESDELLNQVYTDPAPSYLAEKEKIWRHGLTAFYGQLDDEHRWRLIEAAWAKYGEETTRRLDGGQDIAVYRAKLTDREGRDRE